MTWMFWPFFLGPMVLVLGIIKLLSVWHDRAPGRSPLTRALLRSPGEQLRAYLSIDNDTLWSIIRDDVPALANALQRLRDQEV